MATVPYRRGGYPWASTTPIAVLAVAAAYYVTGSLAVLFATPPGDAWSIWPTAGIALASVLLRGGRVWPGIWLGAFLLSFTATWNGSSDLWTSAAIPAAMGMGATLQALAGGALLQRWIGRPLMLRTPRTVALFMALAGPIACVVGPTVGVGSLVLAGALPAEDAAFRWCTWWVGNSIGVAVVTPIVLSFLGEPAQLWRRQRWTVALPLAIGSTLAIAYYASASLAKERKLERDFEQSAIVLEHALRRGLDRESAIVRSIRSVYAASAEVDRGEFRAFAASALARHSGLFALSWSPRVPEASRAEVESAARQDGSDGFEFRDSGADGTLVTAGNRPSYVPILFIEPQEENRPVLGLDVGALSDRAAALALACDTGAPALTGRVPFAREDRDHAGVQLIVPIYENDRPQRTISERRSALRGYVGAWIEIDEFLDACLQDVADPGIALCVEDLSAFPGDLSLGTFPRLPIDENEGSTVKGSPRSRLVRESILNLGGRHWGLRVEAVPTEAAAQGGWLTWGALIAWLFSIPALVGFLLVLGGRTIEIEQRVDELTAERDKLFNLSGDLLCVAGTDGYFRSVNPAFQRALGLSGDELLSRSFLEFVHPQDRAATLAELHSLSQGFDTLHFENRFSHKDGSWRTLVWCCLSPAANSSTVYAAARDVTEQRRAENALRASEERFQLAVSGSAVGIWDWNVVTGQDYYSPRWKELLGYQDDELPNTIETWDSLVHPEDRERATSAVAKHFAKHAPFEIEYRLRHKNGEYRWYHARGQAVWDELGRPMRMAGSLMDIHDKKLAEEGLVESNASLADVNSRLAAQNRQLGEMTERAHRFVDDVSHEFRTPLTVIKEFTSIIADGIGGTVTEQQGEWLRIIDVAVVDLNQMVEDFLDSSKLRARLLRIERRSHNVEAIVAGVRQMMARKAQARSVRLVEDIAPGLPEVFADEEKVRRIIMNLVSNAIKFSPAGGEIRLAARMVERGDIEIAVCDQGPGLSESDMAMLFERFRQLPSALAPSIKGFGLGLNIARQLVWLNLGEIHLSSEPGRGATFSFTLPPNEPSAIVDRFLQRLEERDEAVSSIAALRITAPPQSKGIGPTRRFMAATSRPSDLIVKSSDQSALIVCGPTEFPQRWVERLLLAWEAANAAGRTETTGPLEITLLGMWPFPRGNEEARACLLSNLYPEPAHA